MPEHKKKILAISGSTRADSVNVHILNAIAAVYAKQADITIYTGIDQLPHFNPDLDNETVPAPVKDFRNQVQDADGVLFCTPEYVYSLPGSLKNAIEWTVSTILFTEKPVALITASSSGQKAHEALHLLMATIGARIGPELLIQAPKTKISAEGKITDEATILKIGDLMDTFLDQLSAH
jgi:chromate reductase